MTHVARRRRALPAAAALALGLAAPARAQAPGAPASDARATRLTFAAAAGLADALAEGPARGGRDGPLSGVWNTDRLAMVAVTAARPGVPLELRAEAVVVDPAASASTVAGLAGNGVLPVGRLRVGAGALRPYGVAGVGLFRGAAHRASLNAGGGLRYEGRRYGAYTEVRRQRTLERTYVTLGVTRVR